MKKILVLSSFPASYRVDVFKELAQEYELTVLFGTDSNENRNPDWFVKNDELKYYLINKDDGMKIAKECYKNLKQYDLVLGYDWYSTWALKFELKAMLLGIPYIVNCDGAFINKSPIKDIVKKIFISRATACFAGGEYAKKYFLHYGAKESNIYVHNFTSLHEDNILNSVLGAEDKKSLRKELGLSDKTMVLSIGQFIYRKGFDILIDAWKDVSNDEAQLVIIGGGNLRKDYEEQISKDNIKNITLIDFVPFKDIFKYYMAADIFALATREDIWGLIVNESMADGLPVLISDKCIAGLELVKNGHNGYIIADNAKQEWTARLNELLKNKELRKTMGVNGLNIIRNSTISNIANKHIEVINRILN